MNRLRDDAEIQFGRWQHRALNGAVERATGVCRTWAIVAGLRIPLLRVGRGQPLLLVHGFADRNDSMLPLAALLRHDFDVIAPDLPGFGDTPVVPSARITVAAQTGFLLQLLDVLGLQRVHLCGQSMGGGIVARMAHDHPERVASVTLLAAAGPYGLHPHLEAEVRAGHNPLLPRTLAEFDRLLALGFARPPPLPRPLRRFLAWQWGARHEEMTGHFARMIAPQPGEGVPEVLRPVPVPARVLYGRHERIVHMDNRDLYEASLGRGSVIMLDDVGHAPHLEATATVARVLRELSRNH